MLQGAHMVSRQAKKQVSPELVGYVKLKLYDASFPSLQKASMPALFLKAWQPFPGTSVPFRGVKNIPSLASM